ncbi:MAG: hypothetical protein M1838_005195 [Thelocarpon superellum]|nr:MAG: hypothetical protein M1838_005195 [Thelocarpon superellum]
MLKMCFGNTSDDEQKRELARTREIDNMIRRDEKKKSTEIKLLLLGAGESGKSTVLKQMKLIYAHGFTKAEREDWRAIVFSNINNAYKVILEAMGDFGIEMGDEENEKWVPLINLERDIGPNETLPVEYLPAFKSLWKDSGIQKAIVKGNDFFTDLDRIFAKDYIPNDQDVLRSRLRTTGITETIFELGQLTYRMFDVGGQRSERKKWIHCFENVHCLLFLVAISGYDQCLVEDKDANQMQEALMLFESIANSQWFRKSALILFLNKMDIFREKLEASPIPKYFPDYVGDSSDLKVACKFFEDKFRGLNRNPSKEIYTHFTNATDTNLLKITMSSVRDMIIQRNLHQLILVVGGHPEPPLNANKKGRPAHSHRSHISVSAFFSLHRPISVTSSVPTTATDSHSFDGIFAHRSKDHNPSEVISTLSSTVETLEAASQPATEPYDDNADTELRAAVTSVSISNDANASKGTRHLDGAPQTSPLQFPSHLLSGKFQPFTPPPAPIPTDANKSSAADDALPSATLKKSYSTILTILESTHPNGSKTYTARTSPIVTERDDSISVVEEGEGEYNKPSASAPPARFLERMRRRQERWEEYLDQQHYNHGLYAISVKRQRRLKMKKHKYKKLMRRTRNLRRRLDRN